MNYSFPSAVLIKTSLVDYPGRVASSIFLPGCNLRCPYCYNSALVFNQDEELTPWEQIKSHLEKRRNVLTGLVISGGEALLNPKLPEIITFARNLGYKIKVDTNGTLPDRLEKIISDEKVRPDFIAMDIKTSPHKYPLLLGKKEFEVGSIEANETEDFLRRSINLIASLPANQREWRTVLVPPLVDEDDIEKIASMLPDDASWQFAQFRNENCLNPDYNKILPYTDKEAARLVSLAKARISGAALR